MASGLIHNVADKKLLFFLAGVLGVKAVVRKGREMWRKSNTVFRIDTARGVGGIFEMELRKRGNVTARDRGQFKIYQKKLLPYLGKVIKGLGVDFVSWAQK